MTATLTTAWPASAATCRGSLDQLKQRLAGLLQVLPVDRPIVYLDYPVYLNFGDLLIMRGTEHFCAAHGHTVLGRFACMNFLARARRRIDNQTILVLQGGGNFGDLYPVHQNFREEIVRGFPDNRIVVLPQSVHFSSPAELERSARTFSRHRDLILCVRDHESLSQVHGRFTQNTLLMPDMAHQLWRGGLPLRGIESRTLRLLRADREAAQHQQWTAMEQPSMDWLGFIPRWQCRVFGRLLWLHNAEGRSGYEWGARALWYRYCEMLHQRMEERFLEYSDITTSRLHGMIFSLLLGIRVRYLDNSYGKLGNYANTWFDTSVPAVPHLSGAPAD